MNPAVIASSQRIGTRLTIRVVLAAVVFAALASFASYRWTYAQSIRDNEEALQALSVAVQRTAAMGAFAGDSVLMQELADGMASNRFVWVVRIHSARQTVIGRHPNRGSLPAPGAGTAALVQPLMSPFDAAERVGELQIEPDVQAMGAAASRLARTVVGLLVSMVGLVAVFVNLAAQRLVARPIGRLAEELRRIVPGTDQRVTRPSGHADDEIGVLVETANQWLRNNQAVLERERALRAEVQAMEAQYRRIFDSSSAGIFVMESSGRLINANPTVFRVLGVSEEEVRAADDHGFIERAFLHPERIRALIAGAARSGDTVAGDFELHARGGGSRWVHCLFSVQAPGTVADKGPGLVEGVLYDVTERRRAETAALHDAVHDALTGLINRAGCRAAMAAWRPGSVALCDDEPYTVLFIDLDGFKQINDRHGHGAGDAVLRACAERLQAAVRSTDIVARIGGDEFLIVLRDMRPADPGATIVARQVRDSLRRPIALDGHPDALVGVSIGIACHPLHGQTLEAVIAAADTAMYEVKRTGKDSFALALPPPDVRPEPARRVQSDLAVSP